MKTKKKSILISILLLLGILILINILASRYFFRLDFTGDKRYTLSKTTKNILKGLDDPVTITAYFSEDLPPQITQVKNDFKNLLIEYANTSKGKIVYEFINPGESSKTEQEAMQAGISPVVINVRQKNQAVQKKAYLGAVIKYGDHTETIPLIQQGTAMEYALSSAIKKLTVTDKPLIGFIQGNGEPPTYSMQQVMQNLNVLYKVDNVTLTDSTNLQKYKTLCLVAPSDTIPQSQLNLLDNFLAGGGNLFIALNQVQGNLNKATGYVQHTGVAKWLKQKGLLIKNGFVTDANCGQVSVRQKQGMFSFDSQLSFPYLPIATDFSASNPVTTGLENVLFQFVSPIEFNGDSTLKFVPLVSSSAQSGYQRAPLYFNINKHWSKSDFPLKNEILAALLSGKIEGQKTSKIILIGDGDFAVNGYGQQAREQNEDNISLMVNSIDYLSDDTGLIALRTKAITSRPLKQIKDSTKTALKYFNFLFPIILIIVIGLFRSEKKKLIRNKRMQEDYI